MSFTSHVCLLHQTVLVRKHSRCKTCGTKGFVTRMTFCQLWEELKKEGLGGEKGRCRILGQGSNLACISEEEGAWVTLSPWVSA